MQPPPTLQPSWNLPFFTYFILLLAQYFWDFSPDVCTDNPGTVLWGVLVIFFIDENLLYQRNLYWRNILTVCFSD